MSDLLSVTEFSHPYIDKEIENPEIKKNVDLLIEAEEQELIKAEENEMDQSIQPSEFEPLMPPDLEFEELNLEGASKFEDLCQQESLLEVLVKRQSEFWDDEIKRLEQYIHATAMQKARINSDIAQINLRRKNLQEQEALRISKLEAKRVDLELKIEEMKKAIDELKVSQ